ncbi:hypothetical protein [Enterobacter sp. 22466]|uniref:hypothetical protein n=1 Tax=Enterobacter sp. 22466 TaxID=3453924 RepID=UPI003F8351AF
MPELSPVHQSLLPDVMTRSQSGGQYEVVGVIHNLLTVTNMSGTPKVKKTTENNVCKTSSALKRRSDIISLRDRIFGCAHAHSLKHLMVFAGDRIKSIQATSHNQEAVLLIALARVKSGEHIGSVMSAHGLSSPEDRLLLEHAALHGRAGEIASGDKANCKEIALQYGIESDSAREHLEMLAVTGRAGQKVADGDSCIYIEVLYGIISPVARQALQFKAVEEGSKAVRIVRDRVGVPGVLKAVCLTAGIYNEEAIDILSKLQHIKPDTQHSNLGTEGSVLGFTQSSSQ